MVSESVSSSVCWRCDSRSFVEDYGNRYLPGAWWRYDCAELCRISEIVGISVENIIYNVSHFVLVLKAVR